MIFNGIDFLKDFNWKGRSQVSLTDPYLMERFGSVIFILLLDVQCDISAGELWDKKYHQSHLRNIQSNIKNIVYDKRSATYREWPLTWPRSFVSQAGDLSQGSKKLCKNVQKRLGLLLWGQKRFEKPWKETNQVCCVLRSALPMGPGVMHRGFSGSCSGAVTPTW